MSKLFNDSKEISSLVDALNQYGVSQDDFMDFCADKLSVREIASLIYFRAQALRVDEKDLVINYGLSLFEMIENAQFDTIETSSINEENFPIDEDLIGMAQCVHTKLFNFNCEKGLSTEEVIENMNIQNYRPATLPELLAFNAEETNLHFNFPIVALGSIYVSQLYYESGKRRVPMACSEETHYSLIRGKNADKKWDYSYRFLGVRK